MPPRRTRLREWASRTLASIHHPTAAVADEYHKWYYGTAKFTTTTWMRVPCWKSVSDMWNYQEILADLRPSLIIEFGTRSGGSALFFSGIMRQIGQRFKILSVDVSHELLHPSAQNDPDILFMQSTSAAPEVTEKIRQLKSEYPGRIFAILDSDHTKEHVLTEMQLLRPLLSASDYLLVEDSNINGHPVLPGWGPGPFEAIEAYERQFPADYVHDREREAKFGWTFAPNGYLIRQ